MDGALVVEMWVLVEKLACTYYEPPAHRLVDTRPI